MNTAHASSPHRITLHRITCDDLLYAPYLALREAVLRAPLGLTFTAEERAEDYDPACVHTIALNGTEALGSVLCILPSEPGGEMRLRQVAVAHSAQGTGVGRILVEEAEAIARKAGASGVYLNARVRVQGFYERLGYHTEGETFVKITLPHIRMRKRFR